MILRTAAGISLALGSLTLLVFLHLIGEAPTASLAARHLREMKERRDPPARVQPATIDSMRALPHDWNVGEYSALEGRAVTLEGYVQRTLWAGDGDIHLELAPAPRVPGGGDTCYVTCEITPRWRQGSPAWQYESLLEVFRPNTGGAAPWDSGPRRVRLTGWRLFDFQYDETPSASAIAHLAPRVTGWEVHPVTRIEVWNDARSAYAEVVR